MLSGKQRVHGAMGWWGVGHEGREKLQGLIGEAGLLLIEQQQQQNQKVKTPNSKEMIGRTTYRQIS